MPKIPTFTSQQQMTTESSSVVSDLKISPSNNIFTATQPLQKYLVNEYVKEKKLEADNKATLALSDLENFMLQQVYLKLKHYWDLEILNFKKLKK